MNLSAKYVLAVGAGKGGVGKSTLTAILAQVLNSNGVKVGVLDADLYGPSMRIMMPSPLKAISIQDGLIQPADCQGVKVVGLSYFQMNNVNITRAPVANGLIEKMLFEVNWGELDILLIDLPPGTGDIPLTIMQRAPISAVLLVSTPQFVALSDVSKFMTLCRSSSIPILGLVENMAYFEDSATKQVFYPFNEGKGYAFCKQNEIELLAQIGIDPKLSDALDSGKKLLNIVSSSTREGFRRLCDKVYAGVQKQNRLSFSIEKLHNKVCLLKVLKRKITLTADSIQKSCPCARCETGVVVSDPDIESIKEVAGSSVQFIFSSGCSSGIYPIELLCRIGGLE